MFSLCRPAPSPRARDAFSFTYNDRGLCYSKFQDSLIWFFLLLHFLTLLLFFFQGNIARWLKKEGDQVAPGEVLCEVETVYFLSSLILGLLIKTD